MARGRLAESFAMKTILVAITVLLGTLDPCSQARADDAQTAITSFPRLRPEVYNPAVAARCANVLIQAGEQKACAALLKAVKDGGGDWD